MRKNFILKKRGIKVVLTTIILILAVNIVTSIESIENESMNRLSNGFAGEPIWIYDSDLYIKHVEIAQLNGEGAMDVIAAEYDSDGYDDPSKVYGIDGSDGDTLWTYSLNDGVRSMTIGDINNDGVMDAVAGASKGSSTPDGKVHAIDGTDGSQIWTFTPGSSGYTNGDVAIGNFDGDEYPDVAVACWDNYVYAINGSNGNQLWSTYIGSIFIQGVDTGDVNDDGIDDVAYGHSYLAGYDNFFGVLDGTDGSVIWDMTVDYPIAEGGVLMDDIDDDGELEAVFGNRTGYIFVRDASNGDLEWGYNTGPVGSPTNFDMYLFTYDIDHDNDLDLIVGNDYGSYYIYAFDGDSSTTMWISEKLNGYPKDIAFGDIDGDGNLNIIAATYDRVQILEASDGTKSWYYSVGGTIASVGSADFDDDSIMDTLAGGGADFSDSNPAKSVWALKTVETPLIWEFDFGQYGNALAIDDLNGDQYLDVVTVCSSDDIAWAINGEDGTELWNWTGTENLYAVTTGDFDNDEQIDVAVAGADDKVTALYGNNGSVTWQFTGTGDQIYRKCLQAADLNNDDNIDVIAGCDDGYVYAINGLNGNQLWSCHVGAGVNEVELAQMNASGPLDIVAAVGSGTSGEKVVVIDGLNGSILWSYNAPEAVEHVEVLDVNNDDVPDVAAAITPFTPLQIIMIDGSTHTSIWTKSMSIASNVHSLAHGDLNGDNIPDLVVPGRSSDKKVYALNGSNGVVLWDYETGGEINSVAVDDVDFDNQLEVIAGSDDQNVYVLRGNNGSYFWSYSTADDVMHIQLDDISGDGMPNIACVTFGSDGVVYAFQSFTPAPNLPPYTPSNPSPEDGALYVDPDDDLYWTGGDPNPGDTVTYNVYFGTSSSPPEIVTNQTETSYDPGTMNFNTTYYWKIVAWDNNNVSSESSIWSFTIEGPNNPPYEPSDPDPGLGDTDVDIDADLSWTGGDPNPGDTVTYDVYFGDTTSPHKVSSNQTDTTYDPGTMNFSTNYYWKIVSWDNHGTFTSGLIWPFTTRDNNPPNDPTDPEPEDGATDVDVNADISWSCYDPDGDGLTYDVYFEAGDSTPDVLVSNNQSGTWYDPGKMEYDTHYYWQIVAWDEYGLSTEGVVWDFTTGTEPNDPPDPPSNPMPEDDATDVDLDADLSWDCDDPDDDSLTYDVYFDTESPPVEKVSDDQAETTFDPGTLMVETTYYWQVIAKDEHGASTAGLVWQFTTRDNYPPDAPIINGPNGGKPETEYDFTVSTTDPEGHNVYYWIEWGDDTVEQNKWIGPYSSGEVINLSHSWDEKDTFTITAKAKDTFDDESNSTEFTITIPRYKTFNFNYNLLSWLFERFPIFQRLFLRLGLI